MMHDSMLAWTAMSSPCGELMLMATHRGILRVAFEREDFVAVRESVADTLKCEPVEDPTVCADAKTQIDSYLSRSSDLTCFHLPFDWSLSRGFYAEVAKCVLSIPYGETLTYSQLAERAGRPAAHRAAATACARNPLPILVPCHRVLRCDGSLGGYRGGVELKRFLLNLEQSTASCRGRLF